MTTKKEKAVIILSGGMDSTTLLYDIVKSGLLDVHAVTFDYGQRHRKEIEYANKTCEILNVPQKVITLPFFREIAYSSCLTSNQPVPEGHYADENMKLTVVHNRNMILLSIAAAHALNIGATCLYYGAHGGDHAIYPDCRPAFVAAMREAFLICDWNRLILKVPYLVWSKADIVKHGTHLGVNYSLTWTCYNGQDKACGKCGSCTERLEAFARAKTPDPLEYE